MLNIRFNPLAIVAASIFFSVALVAAPANGLYQIVSGDFTACCGLLGVIRQPLPNDEQSFIELAIDPQGERATITILGNDARTVFTIFTCPPASPFPFELSNGFVSSNRVEFISPPTIPSWNYTVSNLTNGLRLDGRRIVSPGFCADIPSDFGHSNVVALLVPSTSIRVSEVVVCWNALSKKSWRVASQLCPFAWPGPMRVGPACGMAPRIASCSSKAILVRRTMKHTFAPSCPPLRMLAIYAWKASRSS